MKIYNEWMTDNEYFGDENYLNNKLLNDGKKRFEIQKTSLEGKDILIDYNVQERIVVSNHNNPLNQSKYDKKICFDNDSTIRSGSVLNFDNKTWLVTNKIFDKMAYQVSSINECTDSLTFYKPNISPTPIQIPYVVFDSVSLTRMGTESNRYLETPNSRIMLLIPDNNITQHITRNDVYELYNSGGVIDNYKVLDVNRVRKDGLIVLELEWCSDGQNIDEPVYEVVILNGTSVDLNYQNGTCQLNIQVFKDGVIVENPEVEYISENEYVCTVDENGLITANGTGTTNILVKYYTATASIQVNGVMVVGNNYEIVITPSDNTIQTSKTKTFNGMVTNNGVDDLTKIVVWNLSNVDGSNNEYCTYVISDNTITITAKTTPNKDILLRGSLSFDNTVFTERVIKITSLI